MRKNSFLEGAALATISVIIAKILGLLYVIPFYALIGPKGGALYSYGYSIYVIFLSLSTSGIPLAISKIVSEYSTLNQHWTKERVFKIGRIIIASLSFTAFLVLMFFAKDLANIIIGDIKGGNTIEDVTLVIRVISTALLIVPFVSVTQGYLMGQKYIAVNSIANVLEQIARVVVILVGSYLSVRIFNLSISTTVGIAMFGATFGSIVSYLYLNHKMRKYYAQMNHDAKITREETGHDDTFIVKKIIVYAFPLVMIDLVKSFKNLVDTFTYVKTLSKLGYSIENVEKTFGAITTWGSKINMIVVSIVSGISISLIPYLVSSNVKNDTMDISKKINQSIQVLLVIILPMAFGLYFLAQPVWVMFYGYDSLSIAVFKLTVLQTITFSLFSILVGSMQALNSIKYVMVSLGITFIGKIILNVPMMHLVHNLGMEAYYASTITNFITNIGAIIYMLYIIKVKFHVNYKSSITNISKIVLNTTVMMFVLVIMSNFYPVISTNRVGALFEIIVYAIIGASTYIASSHYTNTIKDIFGTRIINILLVKLKIKKA
jgi:O-antigen/teichoic acid export membrane protein